jgi:hypothetical protein
MTPAAEAKQALDQAEIKMADVDDFEPDDEVAANRSMMAKHHFNLATMAMSEGRFIQATVDAHICMDYLEGDR